MAIITKSGKYQAGQPTQPVYSTEDFKTKLLSKYPSGVSGDGIPYAKMDANDLYDRMISKYPNGITSDNVAYKDFGTIRNGKAMPMTAEQATAGSAPPVLGLASTPIQVASKAVTTLGERTTLKNTNASLDSMRHTQVRFLDIAQRETDPVKARAALDEAQRIASDIRKITGTTSNLEAQNLENQRIPTPFGDVPALSDNPLEAGRQVLGRGVKTAGFLGTGGLTGGGALYGAGSAIEQGKPLFAAPNADNGIMSFGDNSIIGEAFRDAALAKFFGFALEKLSPLAKTLYTKMPAEDKAVYDFAGQILGKAGDAYKNFQATPSAPGTLGAVVDNAAQKFGTAADNALSPSFYGKQAKEYAKGALNIYKDSYTVPHDDASLDKIITDKYNQGIRPASKGTPAQVEKYQGQSKIVVKDIAANSNIEDLPTNRWQFMEAGDRGVSQLSEQADAINRLYGGAGVRVSTDQAARELDTYITALKKFPEVNRSAINTALKWKADLLKNRLLTPTENEALIRRLNEELKAFYSSPNAAEVSSNGVRAIVANNLRQSGVQALAEQTGAEYDILKENLAAYMAVRKDLTRAGQKFLTQNGKATIDWFDIVSGSDMATALITGNPTLAVKAGAMKGMKEWFKSFNSPDKAIADMFYSTASAYQKGFILPPEAPGTGSMIQALEGRPLALPAGKTKIPTGTVLTTPQPKGNGPAYNSAKSAANAAQQNALIEQNTREVSMFAAEKEKAAFAASQQSEAQAQAELIKRKAAEKAQFKKK